MPPPSDTRTSPNIPDVAPPYNLADGQYASQDSLGGSFRAQVRTERRTASLNLPYNVDLRAITYVDVVDENLLCPICHCALIDPITTDCDHTFCRECIMGSLSHKEICPVDRLPMERGVALVRSPKIIRNQVDNLKARCPCCDSNIPRSMLKHHLEKYCMEAPVICPGKNTEGNCQEHVKRKYSDNGCLHYLTSCPDCDSAIFQIEMEDHRENLCKERQSQCERCGTDILRCEKSDHDNACPEMIISCKWQEHGCQYESKRIDHQSHANECNFKSVGPMAESLKKEIGALRSDMRTLIETNQLQERRIKFLEKGSHNSDRLLDYSDLPNHPLQSMADPTNSDPLDSAHEYLLSLLEAQESKVSKLSADMTELDSKQTVLLFNETIPIKNELAEMRSNLQVTSMHVRWLMRFRIQENQRRGAVIGPGPGPAPGPAPGPSAGAEGGGSGADTILPRRLSDSMREVITKL